MIPTSTLAICESRIRSASSICSWLSNRSELTRASDSSSALVLLSSSSSLIFRASATLETRQERSSSSVTLSAPALCLSAMPAFSLHFSTYRRITRTNRTPSLCGKALSKLGSASSQNPIFRLIGNCQLFFVRVLSPSTILPYNSTTSLLYQ